MTVWSLALLGGLAAAWLAYGPLARHGPGRAVVHVRAALGLGALRAAACALLLAVLLGAPFGRVRPPAPLALLDVSESWQRAAGPSHFAAARESLRTVAGDSVLLAGDSVRLVATGDVPDRPIDRRSAMRPAFDAAQARQRALVVITDGEPDELDAWRHLPPGSRLVVTERPPAVDLAVSALEAPLIATGGDTIDLVVGLVAGNRPTSAGRLVVTVDADERAVLPIAPLDAHASRRVAVRLPLARGSAAVELAAIAVAADDIEPRNDTLRRVIDVSDRPRAVFVSTAPDLDVREALRVLRGTVAVPTRAYLRLAPGVWREEGSFAPVREAEVERRAREAGLLVLHGDTTWAGVAAARRGPLVLWAAVPPPAPARAGTNRVGDEWFVVGAPPSPLAPSLEQLPFDSLPPLALPGPLVGDVPLLEARLGRRGASRVMATLTGDGARRQLRIAGSGFAAWVQRGGRAADAFAALWGTLFDWTAAAEGAVGGVRLDRQPLRAGEPLVWRRGTADSIVTVYLEADRGDARRWRDSLRLRFVDGAETVLTPALAEGRYRARVGEASGPLIVNPSREWLPRQPLAAPPGDGTAAVGGPSGARRPLRDAAWPFVAALVLLCIEWLARRAVGLR
jgi:hypothetical protein